MRWYIIIFMRYKHYFVISFNQNLEDFSVHHNKGNVFLYTVNENSFLGSNTYLSRVSRASCSSSARLHRKHVTKGELFTFRVGVSSSVSSWRRKWNFFSEPLNSWQCSEVWSTCFLRTYDSVPSFHLPLSFSFCVRMAATEESGGGGAQATGDGEPEEAEEFTCPALCSELCRRQNEQRKAGLFCDLTLLFSSRGLSGERVQTVPAHRSVLSAASQYFELLLGGHFSESRTGRVELKEWSSAAGPEPECVEAVIQFMYTGGVRITSANVNEVLELADRWILTQFDVFPEMSLRFPHRMAGLILNKWVICHFPQKMDVAVSDVSFTDDSFKWTNLLSEWTEPTHFVTWLVPFPVLGELSASVQVESETPTFCVSLLTWVWMIQQRLPCGWGGTVDTWANVTFDSFTAHYINPSVNESLWLPGVILFPPRETHSHAIGSGVCFSALTANVESSHMKIYTHSITLTD